MDEKDEFKKEREERFGGEIRFMTYATFIGEAGAEETPNRGGILYVINDTLYYEDFEKQNALMTLMGKKEKYSKTEMVIRLDDVTVIKEIRAKDANSCIYSLVKEDEILPAPGGLMGLFAKTVVQLLVKNRPSLFFDFLEKEGVLALVNEHMLKPE